MLEFRVGNTLIQQCDLMVSYDKITDGGSQHKGTGSRFKCWRGRCLTLNRVLETLSPGRSISIDTRIKGGKELWDGFEEELA